MSCGTSNNSTKHFIPELEGLRGLLALWVLVSHLMWGSGFTPDDVKGLWIVPFSGGVPVSIFITLSGFVIFLLLDSFKTTYFEYILRRFFRIYPVFLFTSLIGLYLFWQGYGILGGNYTGPNVFVRGGEYYQEKWLIALLQLSMLHGFLPDLGPIVVNPPSWSVSLEWQFYLIAPILFFFFKKNWLVFAFIISFIGVLKSCFHPGPMLNMHGATILDASGSFLIGILSYKIYQCAVNNKSSINLHFVKTLNGVFIVYFLSSLILFCLEALRNENLKTLPWIFSLGIWGLVLLAIISNCLNQVDCKKSFLSILLCNKVILKFGELSYSIYLTHQLIIFIFLISFGPYIDSLGKWRAFFVEFALLVPITILVSYFTNRYIEKPGIKIGKNITAKLFCKK
jgi:peptidoglycan/LPS O-acetylase OafA/YrhL